MKKTICALLITLLLLSVGPVALAQSTEAESAGEPAFAAMQADSGESAVSQFFCNIFNMMYKAYVISTHRDLGILVRINAKKHLDHNQNFDQEFYENGEPVFITEQNAEPIRSMKYGVFRNMWYNGCELIAVYNALLEFDIPQKMSNIIYAFERTGSVWLEGELGTKITQYKKYLEKQGLAAREYRNAKALDTIRKDGDVFVLTYRNKGSLSVHTIMVKQVGEKLVAYNIYGGPFDSFEQLLNEKGSYLLGFAISA